MPSAPPASPRSATLRLRFPDAGALARAIRLYAGNVGLGGLCIRVQRDYAPDERVQLLLELPRIPAPLPMGAVVAWSRPGFIGVRFQPATAEEGRTLLQLRRLADERATAPARTNPAEVPPTKPFSD